MINLSYSQKQEVGNFLEKLAEEIDLTETQYKDANDRYDAVGRFVNNPDCLLAPYKPKLVPQGSIRIGTVTRPVHEECEFDVDGTLRLQIQTPSIQYQIKQLVGDCFKTDRTYARMLEEKNRCWRLKYADSSRFHLDIVPAIPDDFDWLLNMGVPYRYASQTVHITCRNHSNYYVKTDDLPRSNPEGYALWFLDVMKAQAEAIRMRLAAELKMSVDQIPDYRVRTPLQRSIQLMKRHRDLMYGDSDSKPISIIITTLAARSYTDIMRTLPNDQFYDVVVAVVKRMPEYIETRAGIRWVSNPVNPNENFADKWLAEPKLEKEFFRWHSALIQTLEHEKLTKNFAEKYDHFRLHFGNKAVNQALNPNAQLNEQQRKEQLAATAAVISSGTAFTDKRGGITTQATGVKNPEHRFHYGNTIKIPRKKDYRYAYLQGQKKLIEQHYDFLKCRIENNVLKCTGWLQPAGCKDAYKILVEYVVGKEPKTTILYPDIQPSTSIHMYRDHSLCLHYPPDMKWTEQTKIYAYTIPWISEWLIHYELYLTNGNKWVGKESPAHLTETTLNVNTDH